MSDARPVLFVTNHVPPDRVKPFAALHARERIELALFGGRSRHAVAGVDEPGVPHRRLAQRDVYALARSGRFRAVVAGTVGRAALPAAWAGARRARVPFLLWTALWAHPRTPAHSLSRPLLARLYTHADAVVTYGPHVTGYVRRRGARNVHEAPQAVDNGFWSEREAIDRTDDRFTVLFVGRDSPEKGSDVLLAAWSTLHTHTAHAALVLVGAGSDDFPGLRDASLDGAGDVAPAGAVTRLGVLTPTQLRNFYARADVLVMPSIATHDFREPWGLVANEAMNQRTPIVASDAVGAAAGGLVRHGRNGLVVHAGDVGALAAALRRLHDEPELRARLARSAARDVHAYTFEAWVGGFATALRSVGAGVSGLGDW